MTNNNMSKVIYSEDHQQIVKQLKKARIEAGLDQKQVAELLGKTQSFVSKIESGQRKIEIVQLKKLVKIYKKDFSFFIQ